MIDDFDEAYAFASISRALYINIGTLSRQQETGILQAALGAKAAKIPIVFDPVGVGAIPRRVAVLESIHRAAPVSIIKGNMGEIMALLGADGEVSGVKGVDSDGDIAGIEEAAAAVAKKYACVVAATGKRDVVTDGKRLVRLHNGTELLTRITGAGCMVGALCGGTAAAASGDMFCAAIAAISMVSIAGEKAAEKAKNPGSFRTALIDAVYELNAEAILGQIKVEYKEINL
jgi:hydroxyethylthiazole kinase